jgi:putative GTP pyrophosphokinase
MNQQEFRERYNCDVPAYKAYGHHVTSKIMEELSARVGKHNIPQIIKIDPVPRVKEIGSMLEKAFYRGKKYTNPYFDITDKIGTRFVVLFLEQITDLCDIIESILEWDSSKDRDYEEERQKHPVLFDYQSVHYVVRLKSDLELDGIVVLAGTPCEIQIRTLLQHAYSELTHDTIYKPNTSVSPLVHRSIAKSMALIETTGAFFSEVKRELDKASGEFMGIIDTLSTYYATFAEPDTQLKLCNVIIDAYADELKTFDLKEVPIFIDAHPFIKGKIIEKHDHDLLFRQPVVLLLYYLAQNKKNITRARWPFTEAEITPLYTDLGIATPY